MARLKKQTSVRLDRSALEALAALSKCTKVPQAALIREGIDLVLAKREAVPRG